MLLCLGKIDFRSYIKMDSIEKCLIANFNAGFLSKLRWAVRICIKYFIINNMLTLIFFGVINKTETYRGYDKAKSILNNNISSN